MGVRKVVINGDYGGFGLSKPGLAKYAELSGADVTDENFAPWDIPRDSEALVRTVELLGRKANGAHACLKVVEIPDDVQWVIEEYDGVEWVAEVHRTWS